MIRFLQHGALIMAFLGVSLIPKVDLEWRVSEPSGPPAQCTEIVLPPLENRGSGFLKKVARLHTEPALPFGTGLEAELCDVTGYAVGDDYTPGEITADGRRVRPGITAACRWPLGTMVYIEGIGPRVCEDWGTGPPGKGCWVDVAFETPEAAIIFGKQRRAVVVIR